MKWKYIGLFPLLLSLGIGSTALAASPAKDQTTKYRVYQDSRIQREFSNYSQAVSYASTIKRSHVEQIGSRSWLWDNLPRYKVYQYSKAIPNSEFTSLSAAIKEASRFDHTSVKDLLATGWTWDNYPSYQVYQGEFTQRKWQFSTLDQAVSEAKHWANSYIVDLNTNKRVWNQISDKQRNFYRQQPVKYAVYFFGKTRDEWQFSSLEDAERESVRWKDTTVVNLQSGKTVFSNLRQYEVYQNDRLLDKFYGIDQAIAYAKRWAHATVRLDNRKIWNNYPYYQVYQNDRNIGEFKTAKSAVPFALKYANSSIRTYDQIYQVWDNFRNLLFWGWNGETSSVKVEKYVSQTAGLDINSPTWFELKTADGSLNDMSDPELAASLKAQGIKVQPLVHNQFNGELTTKFLQNANAQSKFITLLVNRAVQLGVDGLNIDFESVSGNDRAAFTAFIQKLTNAAHAKGIKITIDLPRGSVKWNHLTAFDHERLAQIVDYIITMTYDQYWSGSDEAGSVAGLQWVEEGIQEFLSYGIPRDKLLLGIPFYQREWTLDASGKVISTKAILMSDSADIISTNHAKKTWDPAFMQYRIEYVKDGLRRVFWLEDSDMTAARMKLAQKYDLAGVAAWRLGYEQPELWNTMLKLK